MLAADKHRYIEGLVDFRAGRENDWSGDFEIAAAPTAERAAASLNRVETGTARAWGWGAH